MNYTAKMYVSFSQKGPKFIYFMNAITSHFSKLDDYKAV